MMICGDGVTILAKCEVNELQAQDLGGLVCGLLQGGSGDDKDVGFEFGEATTWSCHAQVEPWGNCVL